MGVVLFQTPAKYSRRLFLILGTPIVLLTIAAITIFLRYHSYLALSLLLGLACIAVIFFALLLPRRFEVRTDGVAIFLGKMILIPISDIVSISRTPTDFHFGSINMCTSLSHCVYIQRRDARGLLLRYYYFHLILAQTCALVSYSASPVDANGFVSYAEEVLLGPRRARQTLKPNAPQVSRNVDRSSSYGSRDECYDETSSLLM